MGRLKPGATYEQARDSLNGTFQAAALAWGFSTGSSPILVGLPDDDVDGEFEFAESVLLNLLLRLQAATTRTIATIKGICFIRSPTI